MQAGVSDETVLPKGAFAALIGVTPGRVSQMIREGLIGPDALVGEGRFARVRVDMARRQIATRRDPGQALGNGLATRLDVSAEAAAGVVPPISGSIPVPDTIEERIKRERLLGVQIANRRAAEAEEARRGRYVEASELEAQRTRIAAEILGAFEAALSQIARAMAARFGLVESEALHVLTAEFSILSTGGDRDQNRLKAETAVHAPQIVAP